MRKLLQTSLIAAGLSLGMASAINAYSPTTPDVYVVMFRADWCAPCKVVEPRLGQALNKLRDPRIEYVNIDISGGKGDYNAHTVFDRGLVKQYNMWLGVTGFAAIIDGDTKQTLGCVNMNYSADDMSVHIGQLKKAAVSNQRPFNLTCPEPNNPV